jgi:beta-glucanase (GH16 family)
VANGLLTLTSRVDSSSSGYAYTSAMVQTTSFNFTFGTIEFRAKMPRGNGQWPALWLLGANCQQTNISSPDNSGACQWPTPGSNEIDTFEGKGSGTSYGFFNLHNGAAPNSDNQAFGCNGVQLPFDTCASFHTYDLIWHSGSLVWQVDGVTYCSLTSSTVPNTPIFLIMNLAVGGGFGGPVDPSAMPQTLQIDYVRVYP